MSIDLVAELAVRVAEFSIHTATTATAGVAFAFRTPSGLFGGPAEQYFAVATHNAIAAAIFLYDNLAVRAAHCFSITEHFLPQERERDKSLKQLDDEKTVSVRENRWYREEIERWFIRALQRSLKFLARLAGVHRFASDAILRAARLAREARNLTVQLEPYVTLFITTHVATGCHCRTLRALQVLLVQLGAADRAHLALLNDRLAAVVARVRAANVKLFRVLDPVLDALPSQ